MIILDTDHLSLLQHRGNAKYTQLAERLAEVDVNDEVICTSVISLEEQMRGWLAAIAKAKKLEDQTLYYRRLAELPHFYSSWNIVEFGKLAAEEFLRLRKAKIRIGTMDLKIASIALVNEATLLSANLRDFQQVPGLDVQDWRA